MAMLEFRAALLLGHSAAARTVLGWLTERTGDSAELLVMRAWAETAAGRHDRARTLIRPVLDGSVPALLPHTVVDSWLLETSIAVVVGERPAARRALQTALALAEPLDALRPFAQAGPGVRELLVHQHGSFGALDEFADRALAAGAGHERQQAIAERAGDHGARAAPVAAVARRDRPRSHGVGEHRQEPRTVDLHQARGEQPQARGARRPRARPPQQRAWVTPPAA